MNVLNPDAVTLSGGLLAMGDMLIGPMREAMYSLAYGPAAGFCLLVITLMFRPRGLFHSESKRV